MKPVVHPFPHLSRRGFLIVGGGALTAFRALPETPGCTLTAEQEEGPYYVDDETLRRDLTEGKPGVPLLLDIKLVDSRRCSPLSNAALDIWHCDASGVYSGFTANSPDGGPGGPGGPGGRGRGPGGRGRGPGGRPPGPPPDFSSSDFSGGVGGAGFRPGMPRSRQIDATRFLRGVQLTDGKGVAEFATLYPGWYSGRTIHIHMKVHVGGGGEQKYAGGHVTHTGQLFFPEDITERIARMEPYVKRAGVHRTTQSEDGIFRSQHGAECMVNMERLGKADSDGFRATVTLAIDPEATPAPVGRGGPVGMGGPPRRGV